MTSYDRAKELVGRLRTMALGSDIAAAMAKAFDDAVLEERERCAKIADDLDMGWDTNGDEIAEAIRKSG